MADTPVPANVVAFGGFAATPAWTLLLTVGASGRFGYVGVKNNLNVRLALRWSVAEPDSGAAPMAYMDAGDARDWPTQDAQFRGSLYGQGATADPASGDVLADGLS